MFNVNARKLALGSAQFGSPYGVANRTGQTSMAEVEKILRLSLDCGIDTIDTAMSYGDSEKVLGTVGIGTFKVITKLPPCDIRPSAIEDWVVNLVEQSLTSLKVPCLYGLLLHRSQDLSSTLGNELASALSKLQSNGLIKKIGVSIYDPVELESATKAIPLDIVQAPLNLVDRRLEKSGWLSRLKTENIEVHTRSAFLQGLLLMSQNAVPSKFHRWSSLWSEWHKRLNELSIPPVSACLSYLQSLSDVDRIVVGVESVSQLRDLVEYRDVEILSDTWDFMNQDSNELIDPSRWNSL